MKENGAWLFENNHFGVNILMLFESRNFGSKFLQISIY